MTSVPPDAGLPASANEPEGLPLLWQAALFLLLLLLIFSRRPQDILHAQFYAEDGTRWYAQAYNLTWLRSLRIPDANYLQVLPRIAAGVALWVPLHLAPLVLNLFGGVVQALPAIALLSRRCSPWGSLRMRICMAALYIAIPNASEIHVNITNAQWHFALLQILLAFALPPKTLMARTADVFIFILGAFSGPFCVVLLPSLLLFWWWKREGWSLVLTGCLAIGLVFQSYSLLHPGTLIAVDESVPVVSARMLASRIPLGATPTLFIKIVGGDMLLNSMIGNSDISRVPFAVTVAVLLFGCALIACGVRWGPPAYRFFGLITLCLTAAALKSPVLEGSPDRWHALILVAGCRYYFLPTLLFLWAAVYCIAQASVKTVRVAAYAVLTVTVAGAARRWKYEPQPDYHLEAYEKVFKGAKSGDHVRIAIFPVPWTVPLIKH